MNEAISRLEHHLKKPLNDNGFQSDMAPIVSKKYSQPTKDASPASVMICLYKKKDVGGYHIILMKRPNVKRDKHSGQISFPGGRYEKEDIDLASCALRETEEEIGIDRSKIKIIGQLSNLFVFASNHLVHPFVGVMEKEVPFVPDKREVQRVIEVSMQHLVRPSTIKTTTLKLSSGALKNVPYYDIDNEIVWGATAMILSEFLAYWKLSL
ncbi:MAG: CoA pyrophosphatase [Saprospiraceae bacterium]